MLTLTYLGHAAVMIHTANQCAMIAHPSSGWKTRLGSDCKSRVAILTVGSVEKAATEASGERRL
ncbi:MAG: hypothetical protein V1899_03600, partial [Planctomycetota bacterium]